MRMIFGEDATVIVRCGKVEKKVEKQEIADFLTGETAKNIPVLEQAVILTELMNTTVIKLNAPKRIITMIPSGESIQVNAQIMYYLVNM